MKKLLFLLALVCCYGCSDSEPLGYNEQDAQRALNDIKGTYVGNILVDNIPQQISITIGDNFIVNNLPMKPILQRVYTDEQELVQALRSAEIAKFTASPANMAVNSSEFLLIMDPADLQVAVSVNGKTNIVTATISSSALINTIYDELTLNMTVTDLFCDNRIIDVTTNRISYFVDNAQKQAN